MVRKNIKRPRLNSRKRRKLRYAAEHPHDTEKMLEFYDEVITHLEALKQDLPVPSVPDTAEELEVMLLEGLASGDAVETDLGGHPAG